MWAVGPTLRWSHAWAFIFSLFVADAFDGSTLSGVLETTVAQTPCIRLFHSKGSIGCRVRNRDPVTLPVFPVSEIDLRTGKLSLSHSSEAQVAAVIEGRDFNATTLDLLEGAGNVGGILVLSDSAPELTEQAGSCYSHDTTAPQGKQTPSANFVLDPSYEWNAAHGNGLMNRDMDIPINLVSAADAARVREAAATNLLRGMKQTPSWFAELRFYFGSDSGITSLTCLGWKNRDGTRNPQCFPLGGQSVWGVLGSRDHRPVVMATVGIDSTSLFHDVSYGANDAAGSIVVLLAAANALSQHAEALSSAQRQIAFGFFQAEEYGFAGSRRFVADIKSFRCDNFVSGEDNPNGGGGPLCLDPLYPSLAFSGLSLDDIEGLISVDQVTREGSTLYVHPTTEGSDLAEKFLDDSTTKVTLSSATALPPSPLISFLRERPDLSGVVLAGYDTAFTDPAYHSNFDSSSPSVETAGHTGIDASAVVAAASVLANALYRAATQVDDGVQLEVDSAFVSDLVECLSNEGLTCSSIASFIEGEASSLGSSTSIDWGSSPPNYYTSVLSPATGLPLLQHNIATYSRFSGVWNGEDDRTYLVPSGLEMFLRSFLALRLNGITASDDGGQCVTFQDCPLCNSESTVLQECVVGHCVCPVSFYHIALDPGLTRDSTPGIFDVVDDSAPLYTEPNWSAIGVTLFQQASLSLEIGVLVAGFFVTAVSFSGAFYLRGKY